MKIVFKCFIIIFFILLGIEKKVKMEFRREKGIMLCINKCLRERELFSEDGFFF